VAGFATDQQSAQRSFVAYASDCRILLAPLQVPA
jgi:hypothetical protein